MSVPPRGHRAPAVNNIATMIAREQPRVERRRPIKSEPAPPLTREGYEKAANPTEKGSYSGALPRQSGRRPMEGRVGRNGRTMYGSVRSTSDAYAVK